eukprot:7390975-Prymnesium_polylepis.2
MVSYDMALGMVPEIDVFARDSQERPVSSPNSVGIVPDKRVPSARRIPTFLLSSSPSSLGIVPDITVSDGTVPLNWVWSRYANVKPSRAPICVASVPLMRDLLTFSEIKLWSAPSSSGIVPLTGMLPNLRVTNVEWFENGLLGMVPLSRARFRRITFVESPISLGSTPLSRVAASARVPSVVTLLSVRGSVPDTDV